MSEDLFAWSVVVSHSQDVEVIGIGATRTLEEAVSNTSKVMSTALSYITQKEEDLEFQYDEEEWPLQPGVSAFNKAEVNMGPVTIILVGQVVNGQDGEGL